MATRTAPSLPQDIVDQILDLAGIRVGSQGLLQQVPVTDEAPRTLSAASSGTAEPNLPSPADARLLRSGYQPGFLRLPKEMRDIIFSYSLPDKDTPVLPKCSDNGDAKTSPNEIATTLTNRTVDLMLLARTVFEEVKSFSYEERLFEIHIHEGVKLGGIEFIDSGRQPFQYITDVAHEYRFKRFDIRKDFSFHQVKKIKLMLYPPAAGEPPFRHSSLLTYFANQALCNQLRHDDEKLTRLVITFASSCKKDDGSGNQWWDEARQQPRRSSVEGISYINLILLPFAKLRSHTVSVDLPVGLERDPSTMKFAAALRATIEGDKFALPDMQRLEHLVDLSRSATEEYVRQALHGRDNDQEISPMTNDGPDADFYSDVSDYERCSSLGSSRSWKHMSTGAGEGSPKRSNGTDNDAAAVMFESPKRLKRTKTQGSDGDSAAVHSAVVDELAAFQAARKAANRPAETDVQGQREGMSGTQANWNEDEDEDLQAAILESLRTSDDSQGGDAS